MAADPVDPTAIANRMMLSLLTVSPLANRPGVAIRFEKPQDPGLQAIYEALRQKLLREGYAVVSESAPFRLVMTLRPASANGPGTLEAHITQRSESDANPVWTYKQTHL